MAFNKAGAGESVGRENVHARSLLWLSYLWGSIRPRLKPAASIINEEAPPSDRTASFLINRRSGAAFKQFIA